MNEDEATKFVRLHRSLRNSDGQFGIVKNIFGPNEEKS